eukprot:528739-Rhodomonas_salina.1
MSEICPSPCPTRRASAPRFTCRERRSPVQITGERESESDTRAQDVLAVEQHHDRVYKGDARHPRRGVVDHPASTPRDLSTGLRLPRA